MAGSNRVSVGPDMPQNPEATAGTENNLPRGGYRRAKKEGLDNGPKLGEKGQYLPARYKLKSGNTVTDF